MCVCVRVTGRRKGLIRVVVTVGRKRRREKNSKYNIGFVLYYTFDQQHVLIG